MYLNAYLTVEDYERGLKRLYDDNFEDGDDHLPATQVILVCFLTSAYLMGNYIISQKIIHSSL
jgi:hypothetical protein